MVDKGIFDFGKDLGFEVLNFEAMEAKDWVERSRLTAP